MPEPIKKIKLEVLECTCLRCDHVWLAKIVQVKKGNWMSERPVACSRCKNPRWDRPRSE